MAVEAEEGDPQTLEFLVGAMERTLDRQLGAVDGLDAKVVQVFATASVVIGLAAAGLHGARHATLCFLIAAVVAYVATVGCAAVSLWIRGYCTVPAPDDLWANHAWDSIGELRITLADAMVRAYRTNVNLMPWKVWAVKGAIFATGAEALCVGIAVILTVSR